MHTHKGDEEEDGTHTHASDAPCDKPGLETRTFGNPKRADVALGGGWAQRDDLRGREAACSASYSARLRLRATTA